MALRFILQPPRHYLSTVFSNIRYTQRLSSTSTKSIEDECVVSNDEGSMILCWHPEKPILYEHTKPIPEIELCPDYSVLKKIDLRHLQRPKPDELVRKDLMDLTYTTKHRWFPKSRTKKIRRIPPQREFL